MRAFPVAVSFLAILTVVAQDLAVPTTWVGTTSADTRATREGYANAAAQAVVTHIGSNGSLTDQANGQALASMYSNLALQDWLSGNKTWQSAVMSNVQTWVNQNDVYGNGTVGSKRTNTNGLQWALALFYAYKAYNQSSLLEFARATWDTVHADFITVDMVATPPKQPLPSPRNLTWLNATGCLAKFEMAGAVFWLPGVSENAQIQQDNVGPFSALAGYLFEETQNETYKDVGLQTLTFMETSMQNYTSKLQYGVFDFQQCQVYGQQSPGFQGWYIQPLSIWANITGDSKWTELLRQVVSATALNTEWSEADGVLKDPDTNISDDPWDDKAILIRALSEVLRRFPSSSDLTAFTEAFLTIQYTHLTSNARSGSNYSTSLYGPAPPAYNSNGNIVALDVLNAAFDSVSQNVAQPSSSSSTQSATSTSGANTSSSASSTPIGAIVGGTIGGVIALSVVAGLTLWYRRAHRNHKALQPTAEKEERGDATIAPFLSYGSEPYSPSTPGTPAHTPGYINEATTHPKMQRYLVSSPSVPNTHSLATSTSPLSVAPSEDAPTTPHANDPGAQDMMTMLRRVVDSALRDRGVAPPEYEG